MRRLPHAQRRIQLVRAAMLVFARDGFRGARTREIAAAAGVSEALLYRFFPTKRELQRAIIEERIRQVGPFLTDELRSAAPGRALEALAARFIALCERDPTFLRLLLFSGLEGEPLAPMFFKRRVARNIGLLAGLFDRWKRRGQVRATLDSRFAAWCFMACVFQLITNRLLYRVPNPRARLAASIVDIFFHGVRP
jgi:AcrR family transcriptional regulator